MISPKKELIRQALNCQAYKEAIGLLSQAIEGNDDQLDLYWDLGLAYLFNDQPDDAEAIWLEGVTKGWEWGFSDSVEQLGDYLREELEAKKRLGEQEKVWLLRCQLQNLDPEDWDNTLKLIQLGDRLDKFEPEQLLEWEIVERLEVLELGDSTTINPALLLDCTLIVLKYPTQLSLDFFAVSIPKFEKLNWLDKVMKISEDMATTEMYPNYARSIASICLNHYPNNLYVIHRLMSYCEIEGNELELAKYGRLLYDCGCQANDDISKKCFIYSRVLLVLMRQSCWQEIEEKQLFEKLTVELQQLVEKQIQVLDTFFALRFWAIPLPFGYLYDTPAIHRLYFNQTAALFQKNCLSYLGQQVSFTHSPNIELATRPLKIGYIGHTLKQHSVGWLSRWLFHYHDKKNFQLYFYLVGQNNDELTEAWIFPNAHKAHNYDRNAVTVARDIYNDKLDLLVDLDGLTNNVVAQVLALKPALIQATWLGSDASGLPVIDYFLVDKLVLPPENQQYYQEKLWYLPQTYIAVDGFEVGTPTLTREALGITQDAVIYLTVQYSLKYHPQICRLQLEILQAVPTSVLLIKGGSNNQSMQTMTANLAAEMGIDQARIIFLPRDADEATHRANLSIADVVLDTYPYSGATTTLETLWMAIPMVTWVGEQFSARNSYAFMRQVELTAGIAYNADEYVEWGIRLGRDLQLRQEIKQTLKKARKSSPLWQAEAFTREMEEAYKKIIEGGDQ